MYFPEVLSTDIRGYRKIHFTRNTCIEVGLLLYRRAKQFKKCYFKDLLTLIFLRRDAVKSQKTRAGLFGITHT